MSISPRTSELDISISKKRDCVCEVQHNSIQQIWNKIIIFIWICVCVHLMNTIPIFTPLLTLFLVSTNPWGETCSTVYTSCSQNVCVCGCLRLSRLWTVRLSELFLWKQLPTVAESKTDEWSEYISYFVRYINIDDSSLKYILSKPLSV